MVEARRNSRRPRRADHETEPASRSLGEDPLSADAILEHTFYVAPSRERGSGRPAKPKPSHYKVVSISLYTKDIERLDEMVKELKRRGHTKASKSQLIRFALDTVDLDALPRGY